MTVRNFTHSEKLRINACVQGAFLRNLPSNIVAEQARNDINKLIKLHAKYKSHNKIYLDLKFLIGMREAESNNDYTSDYYELLQMLRNGVDRNLIVCPASYPIYTEITKQNRLSQERSLKLLHELSNSLAINHQDTLIKREIRHCILSRQHPGGCYPIELFAFTTNSDFYSIAEHYDEEIDSSTAINKHFTSLLLQDLPVTELIYYTGSSNESIKEHTQTISALYNQFKADNNNNITVERAKQQDTYVNLEPYILTAIEVERIYTTGTLKSANPVGSKEYKQELHEQTLTFCMFINNTNLVPTLTVGSEIRAAMRCNLQQKIKNNDIIDIEHAMAAVPYCDAFFTEKALSSILNRKDLSFGRSFNCKVMSGVKEAIKYVSGII